MDFENLSGLALRWRMLGEVVEAKWNQFLDFTGDDPQLLWVLGTTVLLIVSYWLYAAIFTYMDVTNTPRFVRKYKVQPGQNEPVDKLKLMHVFQIVLFNQFVAGAAAMFVLYQLLFKFRNIGAPIRTLPSLPKLIIDLVLCAVLEEFVFYYIHRLLHLKPVYKRIHKRHHEWTSPIAVMTIYGHPLEHIMCNIVPIGIAVALLKSHIITMWIYFLIAVVNSISDHSGYSFPFLASTVANHDLHHENFMVLLSKPKLLNMLLCRIINKESSSGKLNKMIEASH